MQFRFLPKYRRLRNAKSDPILKFTELWLFAKNPIWISKLKYQNQCLNRIALDASKEVNLASLSDITPMLQCTKGFLTSLPGHQKLTTSCMKCFESGTPVMTHVPISPTCSPRHS